MVDEIIEIARLHAVILTIVNYRQDLMTKYEDIAAVIWEAPPKLISCSSLKNGQPAPIPRELRPILARCIGLYADSRIDP